jgi:hypothetical protein
VEAHVLIGSIMPNAKGKGKERGRRKNSAVKSTKTKSKDEKAKASPPSKQVASKTRPKHDQVCQKRSAS